MPNNINQTHFDAAYITSAEITRMLGISRAGFLYGRRNGKLPTPIVLNGGRLVMWERTPEVLAEIAIWKDAIDSRKVA